MRLLAASYLVFLLQACGASIEVGSSEGTPASREQEAGDANSRTDAEIVYPDLSPVDGGDGHTFDASWPPVGGGTKHDSGVSLPGDAEFE